MEEKEDDDTDPTEDEISNSDVVTKYKTAADIANRVLGEVIKQTVPGKLIVDLCMLGDKLINEGISSVYSKGKVDKGVAFPTSISINNCVGHFSPLAGDTAIIQESDLVKVDLGVHIDGFIALVAHTFVATSSAQLPPVTGRQADVISAAFYAAECAHRLMKPGVKNSEVSEVISKVAEQFKCQPMEAVLSHQMKRFVVDGNKTIISKSTLDQNVEEFEFEENQVFAVDIVMSTAEGKSRQMDTRTTIYKRAVDQNYLLKMKAARYVFNEINSRFPTFPFTLRALDEKRGKLGIKEMLNHDLVHPYPVLYEKSGEFVAQFKFTVLILASGTVRLDKPTIVNISSDKKIEDQTILELLQTGTKRTKKKNKKKKKKKDSSQAEKDLEDEDAESSKSSTPQDKQSAPMDTNL